jgi:biopolymer transport protein ExbD
MSPEPEVQFRPDANARYERTAGVLRIVKASRVTRFGFIDNDKYREFGRAE